MERITKRNYKAWTEKTLEETLIFFLYDKSVEEMQLTGNQQQ